MKTVIISGGSGVLGQAYARALSADGYTCVLLDVKEPGDEKHAGEYIKCDVTSIEDIARVKQHLIHRTGTIAGLVNNASIQPEGFGNELETYSADTFRSVLDVNLVGSFLLTQMVIPFMVSQKNGSIVNIGSIQGVVAPTFEIYEGMPITSPLVYAVAKAGLIHFCRWVAAKYGRYNIRCNAVSPGGLGDSQKGGSDFEKIYASKTPLGRMALSTEIAEMIRFLISDKSAYITGQNIVVDGGWTAH